MISDPKEIRDLEERFQHYDIHNQMKDRLIWEYLLNRKDKRAIDSKQNEVDTDWEN